MTRRKYSLTLGVSDEDRAEDIRKLINAGADEFYCGIVPEDWSAKYGYQISTNRREFRGNNFVSFKTLARVVEEIHSLGKEVFVTFNANYYVDRMYAQLFSYLKQLQTMKVDGLIVGDLGLILALEKKEIDIPLILSGEAGVYNSEALDFFRKFNLRRVIFPRHLSSGEIVDMVNDCPEPRPEFEVFLKNQRCPFNSNVCTTSHGWAENRFCFFKFEKILSVKISDKYIGHRGGLKKNFEAIPSVDEVRLWIENCSDYDLMTKTNSYLGEDVCGVCAMDRFLDAGIEFFKVVSRGYDIDTRISLLEDLEKRIRQIKKLRTGTSGKDVLAGDFCRLGYCCYYRDI